MDHLDTDVAEWTDDDGHKWEVRTEYVLRGDRWEVVGVQVRSAEDPPHRLTRALRDAAPMQSDPSWSLGIGPADVARDGTWSGFPGTRRGRPPKFGPGYYRKVASVYRQAQADGRPPRLEVMKVFDLPERTAARHIAKARTMGLLRKKER
jgi:hypothetical protein